MIYNNLKFIIPLAGLYSLENIKNKIEYFQRGTI